MWSLFSVTQTRKLSTQGWGGRPLRFTNSLCYQTPHPTPPHLRPVESFMVATYMKYGSTSTSPHIKSTLGI